MLVVKQLSIKKRLKETFFNGEGGGEVMEGCCTSCYMAKTKKNRCVCKCKGRFHGLGKNKGVLAGESLENN